MAKNDDPKGTWPSFRAILLIVFGGMLLAQPAVRKRQRGANTSGAEIGETVASTWSSATVRPTGRPRR